MDTKELIKKVRIIEIKTKGLSNQIFSGEYHSAFKGRGMAFSENREYAHGDEIRTIDWNVTARMRKPFVKVFEEERELTAVLLIDVSASENFGSKTQLKRSLITELAAVISFSALQNNDKIGVILFSDHVEKFIPPKKGKTHILKIIRDLIEFEPKGKGTNIGAALDYLNSVVKKRSIVFLMSDFIDENYEDKLKSANKKHDLVALQIVDPMEESLPNVGLVKWLDAESGTEKWINTSSKKVRCAYEKEAKINQLKRRDAFRRAGVDSTIISTNGNYIKPLMNLFKHRS